ncbi:DNA-formamidopyrimidine glycosylase family protein [Pedobacter gandavensis]|uniref:DNA-formamidopyrimidine glycosylase family protein n=1 Tax=Pedobacter gandavensis TaxID=2679963 RepID=UPI00292FA5DA|nr:DNA-formamidopyrimidine glycosylase family protein [Pedobacter gandavensis]
MPELPDLEVFSANLNEAFAGKKLSTVQVPNDKKLNVTPDELRDVLNGQVLKSVSRSGKELRFNFEKDVLALHLMLRGQLHYFEEDHDIKYPIIELFFEGDVGLVMSDPQKMAAPTLNPAMPEAPDALDKKVTVDFLLDHFKGKKGAIKGILLDQNQIRGIGNAYADEILWKARLSPFSIAGKIPEAKVKALHEAIKEVLTDAVKEIRKVHPGSITGEFRDFLKVHTQQHPTSPTGAEIIIQKSGARKTYYTEEQELFN